MPFVTARISSSTALILQLHKGISALRHTHHTNIIGEHGLRLQCSALSERVLAAGEPDRLAGGRGRSARSSAEPIGPTKDVRTDCRWIVTIRYTR
jgi:hypothetical protein